MTISSLKPPPVANYRKLDYYPFGMEMPNREHEITSGYRYGFNGQERSTEIAKGITTALFWEYDSRIGKRWNLDPKPNLSFSPYLTFGNNPIFNSDGLGDTLRGNNNLSATRQQSVMRSSFKSEESAELKSLFKLKDETTFAPIDGRVFYDAIKNLSYDEQALATGYFLAINGAAVHTVEVLTRSELISPEWIAKDAAIKIGDTGAALDKFGGGSNKVTGNSSYTIYVLFAKHTSSYKGDYVDGKGGFTAGFNDYNKMGLAMLPTTLSAHEILGHGLGKILASPMSTTHLHEDALQMDNLASRVTDYEFINGDLRRRNPENGYWRNGLSHGTHVQLSYEKAHQIPAYIENTLRILHVKYGAPVEQSKVYKPDDDQY